MSVSSIPNRQLTNSVLYVAKNTYCKLEAYFNINKIFHEVFDGEIFIIVKTKRASRGNFRIGKL